MADRMPNRNPDDLARVNAQLDYEVRYWTEQFGCTEEQLGAAVAAVGAMAKDVEAYLKRNR